MPDNRGSRFALEVLFLLALAVALTLANLKPIEIAGIMLVGWVIVAALEWAAWREQPHYGSGLPPRYYVPQVSLPPAQPLEQVSAGYPGARDEAPTWIASAALREEMLGEWPVAAQPASHEAEQESEQEVHSAELESDPWTRAEELPAAPLAELEADYESAPVAVAVEQAPPVEQAVPVADETGGEQSPVIVLTGHGVARYSLDPLAEPEPRRRFGRGGRAESAALVEVPARPGGARALPGRTNRQD